MPPGWQIAHDKRASSDQSLEGLLPRSRLLVTYLDRDLEVLGPAAFAQDWRDHDRLDLRSAAVNE